MRFSGPAGANSVAGELAMALKPYRLFQIVEPFLPPVPTMLGDDNGFSGDPQGGRNHATVRLIRISPRSHRTARSAPTSTAAAIHLVRSTLTLSGARPTVGYHSRRCRPSGSCRSYPRMCSSATHPATNPPQTRVRDPGTQGHPLLDGSPRHPSRRRLGRRNRRCHQRQRGDGPRPRPGKGRIHTSTGPVAFDVYASHRPCGNVTDELWAGGCATPR